MCVMEWGEDFVLIFFSFALLVLNIFSSFVCFELGFARIWSNCWESSRKVWEVTLFTNTTHRVLHPDCHSPAYHTKPDGGRENVAAVAKRIQLGVILFHRLERQSKRNCWLSGLAIVTPFRDDVGKSENKINIF